MSVFSDLADAVVAELVAGPPGTLPSGITPARTWLVDFELKDVQGMKISVLSHEVAAQIFDRGREALLGYTVDVLVQQKTDGSNAQVDAVVNAAETIFDYLRTRDVLVGSATYVSVRPSHVPVIASERFLVNRVAQSLVTMVYQVSR